MAETKNVNKNAVERRIQQMLQRLPQKLRYGDSNPPENKRCPICESTIEPERLPGGWVVWRCRFCRYISIQGHRNDRWRATDKVEAERHHASQPKVVHYTYGFRGPTSIADGWRS